MRRFSWSPYEQTRQVVNIYVHEKYDSKIFLNDIALMKLDHALYLSKWVAPACLAPRDKSLDPLPKQLCSVIGCCSNHILISKLIIPITYNLGNQRFLCCYSCCNLPYCSNQYVLLSYLRDLFTKNVDLANIENIQYKAFRQLL